MKVVDFIKKKSEILAQAQHQFQLKEWISPTIRDYWTEFLNKANNTQLASWVREHPLRPLTNDNAEAQPKAIVLHPEAQTLLIELSNHIGQEIHVGEWLEIDQQRIDQFAEVTMDFQWIHTDPERAAAESPFKTTIAHGFLTLSLLPVLTESVNPDEPMYPTAKMAVNYGLNQVRYPYPVKVGNKLRARTRLAKIEPIKRGLELTKEITIEIEGCRRPACVAESIVRLYF
ncbi:MaoC family dehydratase [Corallincola spongiicola]|uniref:MaoC family dehydratase n=1 Tax=Corallincola spongiicola TaxID=2520508 RepID=A0ABY1WN53_9GAMM|nr:MaoC family dehydratase [Corallincola spongiicola]TAA44994.1 MaoC family dehydratase [Corallincola spongiicola]